MNFNALLNTIIMLFIFMAVGFVANKLGIIDEISSKRLSKLIITICQPCLIIASLAKFEYSSENLKLGFITLGLGILIHSALAVIAFFACRPFKDIDEQKITEFCMIFGNAGFIGFPILQSLFGDKGLFMGAFFVISFHLVLWTWGIAILARKRNDIKLTVRKIFINFGTVPSAIGITLFLLNFEMPKFITSTLGYLGDMCTPVSMLIIGALLARTNLISLFKSFKVYYLSLMKLIISPLIVCAIMKLVGFPADMTLFMTAVCCLPSATTVSMLSELYNLKSEYSAQLVGMSSLLSLFTIPTILLLAEFIVKI